LRLGGRAHELHRLVGKPWHTRLLRSHSRWVHRDRRPPTSAQAGAAFPAQAKNQLKNPWSSPWRRCACIHVRAAAIANSRLPDVGDHQSALAAAPCSGGGTELVMPRVPTCSRRCARRRRLDRSTATAPAGVHHAGVESVPAILSPTGAVDDDHAGQLALSSWPIPMAGTRIPN